MSRRETIRMLVYFRIRYFGPEEAYLGDWCIWSPFKRNIGERLLNNHDHIYPTDMYIKYEDKLRINMKEYDSRKKS